MREYVVIKEILNIRSEPSDEGDDTFVGQLHKGERVWLDDEELVGVVPKGGESNLWKIKTGSRNVVAKDGIVDISEFWIKEYGIDNLWQFTKGENVTVILIDSGISDFEDLNSEKILKSSIFNSEDEIDKVGHGTLMASIISGKGIFIKGPAPLVDIVSIKITNKEIFDDQNFISALEILPTYLKNNKFSIVNCSFNLRYNLDEATKIRIQQLVDNLYLKYNLVFIAAVGNNGKKEDEKTVPASLEKVISCAAFRKSRDKNIRLSDSNYWPEINVTAPGEFPASQINNNLSTQGSSQASAFVTGLISLFISKALQKNKILSHQEVVAVIKDCTTKIEKDISYNILNKESIRDAFNKI